MKRILTFLVFTLSLTALNGSAFAETYAIDPVHSSIGFKVKHLFSKVTGRFAEVTGDINVDPNQPENSSVNATIEAKSIDTQNAKRDAHLKTGDFFDVEKFPAITFKSKQVKKIDDKTADVIGDLTIHGVTKEVPLRVTFLGKGPGMAGKEITGWEAKTTINRKDFGLTWGKMIEGVAAVGDEVEIELQIEAPKKA